jgi:hypothetical protein
LRPAAACTCIPSSLRTLPSNNKNSPAFGGERHFVQRLLVLPGRVRRLQGMQAQAAAGRKLTRELR